MSNLSVSLVQADMYWQDIGANLAMFEEKIWQLEKTDVILLPEMFTTGFTMEPKGLSEPHNSKTFRWMAQMAAQTKSLVIGSYIISESNSFFNRLYAVFPDGNYKTYDKRHLFSLVGEDQQYVAGKEKLIINWRGWNICPMICYDLRFPVWSRSVNYEYDLLVYIANWPTPRVNAWDTLLQARAIENIAYVAGVNRIGIDGYKAAYSGHSAIYNYKGEPVGGPFVDRECSVSFSLEKKPLEKFRDRYNFFKEADSFKID